jgi:hypothetical protein
MSCHTPSHHILVITIRLLVILIRLVVDNVEEAELVDTLGGRDDAKPVTELLLLEELLCAIIAVSMYPPISALFHSKRTGTSSSDRRTPGAQ